MAVSVQSCFLPEWHAGSYSTRTSRLGVHFDWTLKRGGACAKKGMGYNNSFGELHETATKIYIKAPASVQRNKTIYKMLPGFFLIFTKLKMYNTTHSQQPCLWATSCFLDSCLCCTIVPSTSFSCQCCCTKVPVTSSYSCYSCYRSHRISSRVFVYHQDQGLCYMLHYHPFSVPLLGVKRHACVCCYYYTTFFTLDFVGSDANNCGWFLLLECTLEYLGTSGVMSAKNPHVAGDSLA